MAVSDFLFDSLRWVIFFSRHSCRTIIVALCLGATYVSIQHVYALLFSLPIGTIAGEQQLYMCFDANTSVSRHDLHIRMHYKASGEAPSLACTSCGAVGASCFMRRTTFSVSLICDIRMSLQVRHVYALLGNYAR